MNASAARILIVDDQEAILKTFQFCLESVGHRVATARGPAEAESQLTQQTFDVCFLDLWLGEHSALDLLPVLKSTAPELRVVVVTAHSSIDTAVAATRAGANDYLVKPCSPEQLRMAAVKQLEARQMRLRIAQLEQRVEEDDAEIAATRSYSMQNLLKRAKEIAGGKTAVLLLGESGTGKGMLARAIHGWSSCNHRSFITLNCPALEADKFESALFGSRCNPSNATSMSGYVELAAGGTLFLDEVGAVPLSLQPKILQLVQEHFFARADAPALRQADVRLIAASQHDLSEMASHCLFDLNFLGTFEPATLRIPPLRERPEDIEPLAQRFLTLFLTRYGRNATGFSRDALRALREYPWPGNVRELRNIVERACILCQGGEIEIEHLALTGYSLPTPTGHAPSVLSPVSSSNKTK